MFAGKTRPLLFRVRLKVLARKDLVSPVTVGRAEITYRMVVRESRLTSRLQQCLEATWKQKSEWQKAA